MEEAEDVYRFRGCLDEHDEAAVEGRPGEVVRVELLPLGEAAEGLASVEGDHRVVVGKGVLRRVDGFCSLRRTS